MATGLAGINTLCTVKIGLIFITPCLLSLYQNKKQYMIITFLYTFILLCLSSYPRALGFDTFLMLNINKGHKVSEHVFASIFVLTVETIAVFSLLVPYYKYILDLKITKNQFLEEKANATDEVLQFCSKTMSYHNKYLAVHCTGVEAITTIILKDLIKRGMYSSYLTPEKCKEILFSVQFHDIGKIYIDPAILDKPGKLTDEEYTLVKEHPEKGFELFQTLPKNAMTKSLRETCGNVIVEHHERLDGRGYPYNKKSITLEGQIVAVADVVDALVSWRPYKQPMNWNKMIDIISSDTGLNQACVLAIVNNKEEVLKVAEQDNQRLAKMFNFTL